MPASLSLPLFPSPSLWKAPEPKARRSPRYYQADAKTSALANLEAFRSTLLVMATGTGKTFTAAQIMKALPGPWLWINERDNLVSQVRKELSDMLEEEVYIEQGDLRAPAHARVVVGSLQSVCQPARLAKMAPDRFGGIVFDESHHAVAESYRRIPAHFSGAKVMGLTATPDRMDGRSMSLVFESQSANYQIHRGVEDGYLVPIQIWRGRRIDVSKLRGSGEFTDNQIASVMGDDVLKMICEDTLRHQPGKRGVLYFPRVDIAHVAAKLLNSMSPGCAQAVDGEQERGLKRAMLKGHRRGDYLYLCNVGVVEEGHDDPGIMFVGLNRPTKSRAKYTQWGGRPLRPLCNVDQYATAAERRAAIAASAKPFAEIMDFVGNSGKHDLASAVDALAGDGVPEEIKKKARQIIEEHDGGDVWEAINTARRLDEAEQKEEAARVLRVKAAQMEWKKVNPFDALGIAPQTDVATALTRASSKIRMALVQAGLSVTDSLTQTDAQRLLRTVKARQKAGLADFGQIKILSKVGISAHRMYKGTARRLMDAVSANRGWPLTKSQVDAIVSNKETP